MAKTAADKLKEMDAKHAQRRKVVEARAKVEAARAELKKARGK